MATRGRPSNMVKPAKNTPRRLVQLYKKFKGNYYQIGKKLDINPGHVFALIVHGIEPKREDLRKKLFLSRKRTPEELEKIRETKRKKKEEVEKEISEHFSKVLGGAQ